MIQRIQTLFLLLSFICTSMFFYLPFGEIVMETGDLINIDIFGISFSNINDKIKNISTISVLILILLINIITFATIFLYKKRILQIRLSFFNMVLQIGSIGLIMYNLIQISNSIGVEYSAKILVILPLVASIFTFLAIRAIGKDELLIRSINRIR